MQTSFYNSAYQQTNLFNAFCNSTGTLSWVTQSISHSSERGQMIAKSVSIHAQINPFCHGFYAVWLKGLSSAFHLENDIGGLAVKTVRWENFSVTFE